MSLVRIASQKLIVCSAVVVTGAALATYFVVKTRNKQTVRTMETALNKPTVHFKDKERVLKIVQELVSGGREQLQVIVDFDMTLSRFNYKGKRNHSCYSVFGNSDLVPSWYTEQANKLRETYYAIEIDPHLTNKEKVPFMVEWWTKAHDLLLQCNLTHPAFKEIVREANIILRDGSTWMFQQLHKSSVPLLIFSAGIGDIIEEVIHTQYKWYDNMKVISNYLDFNHQGVLVGFKGELLHVYNKNESAIHQSDYFDVLSHRHNVLLLGDSLGDLHMADGANAKNILKIGFLNDKVEERLTKYLNAFDIVLVSDETMDVPNAILKDIL